MAASKAETTAFQPAKDSPRKRQEASSQRTIGVSTMPPSPHLQLEGAGAFGRPGPPFPLDAGVIDADCHVGEEGERDEEQEDAGDAGRLAPREQNGGGAGRDGEIIGVALLEAERAWRIAAEMLEGERGEDGGAGDRRALRRCTHHHWPRRQGDHRLAGGIHIRRHIWR